MGHVICEHCSAIAIIPADKYAKHLLKIHKIKLNPILYDLEKKINDDRTKIAWHVAKNDKKRKEKEKRREKSNSKRLDSFDPNRITNLAEKASKLVVEKASLERQVKSLTNTRDKRLIDLNKHYDRILIEERKIHENKVQAYEDNKYRKMYEELLVENKKLEIKYTVLAKEHKSLQQEKSFMEIKFSDTAKKLENVQRKLKELGVTGFPKAAATKNQKEEITDKENDSRNLGGALDGSSGFYNQRENGRFGSLSSFDNYDDAFNDV